MGQLTPLDPASTDVLLKFDQKASLENLAEILKVKRQGPAHQAGSDALLTGKIFFQIRERIFNGEISPEHLGKVWGLGLPDYGHTGFNLPTQQHYHQELQENTTPGQNGNAFANGAPSTPNTGHAGLASTPAPANNSTGIGPLTPGGGGGVFGAFQFAK